MKVFRYLFFVIAGMAGLAYGQAPEAINYQSVIRNSSGMVMDNQDVQLRFSILQGSVEGTMMYTETHQTSTNKFGIVNLKIGQGLSMMDFSEIDWASGPYFIQVSLLEPGQELVLGTSQLVSVPYALHANIARSAIIDKVDDADADPTNELQKLSVEGNVLRLSHGGGEVQLSQGIQVEGPISKGNLVSYDGKNWVARDIATGTVGQGTPINNMQPFLTVNYCIALQGIYPSRSTIEPFMGQIATFAFNYAPPGWAECNGQLVPINQNQALFSLLGMNYGGDGRTTFALPDLRGRTPIHQGTGIGLSPRTLGHTGGSENITLINSNLPAHNHEIFIKD